MTRGEALQQYTRLLTERVQVRHLLDLAQEPPGREAAERGLRRSTTTLEHLKAWLTLH